MRLVVALFLALCAPVAAQACDITTDPVSPEEVKAAGLGPLMRQADQQAYDDTHALMDGITTKAEAEAAAPEFKRINDAWHNRMVIIAQRARCGRAD